MPFQHGWNLIKRSWRLQGFHPSLRSGIRDPGVGSWSCIACPDRFLSLVIAYGPKPLWLIPDDLFCNTMQSQTTYQHPEVPQKVHSHVPPEMRSLLENYPHELDNPPVLGSSFAFVWCFWPEHQELSLKVKGSLDWWEKTDADTGRYCSNSLFDWDIRGMFPHVFLDKDSSETIEPCRPPALSHWSFPTGDLPKL